MDTHRKYAFDLFNEKIEFQGRLERLDWKRIASIDIDNLIREGDTSQLQELISPVTFCKADSEFDQGRIDPGFIKVFRLSQLISEYLLLSREKNAERLSALESKYNETEKERVKLSEENSHLKESLTSAKKELKKRKEMIASTQSEMLGQNNGDEFDQCPYCSKKFLSSGFLIAHIQRRHQGLPINPLYHSFPPAGTSAATAAAVLPLHHHPPPHSTQPQHPHLLTCNPQQQHQQQRSSGNNDSPGILQPPSPLQVHTALQTPSSSILNGMTHFAPNCNINPSFSGSVTSLNQMYLNGNENMALFNPNANSTVVGEEMLTRRDSFTQTSLEIEEKATQALVLEQVPENPAAGTWDSELSRGLQEPSTKAEAEIQHQNENKGDQMKSSLENAQPQPILCGNGDGGGGGDADGSHGSWKRALEETEMHVMRIQDELRQRCENLEEIVRQKEIEEKERIRSAPIQSQTSTITVSGAKEQQSEDKPAPTSRSSNSNVGEGKSEPPHAEAKGEVTKSSSGVLDEALLAEIVKRDEIEDLKNALQTAVQEEINSLKSRLESQEQFWEDKLAIVNENHEKQIQQLRQELKNDSNVAESSQNSTSQEQDRTTVAVATVKAQATRRTAAAAEVSQHEPEDSQSDQDQDDDDEEDDRSSESGSGNEDDDEENDEEAYPSRPETASPKVHHKPPLPHQPRGQHQQSEPRIGARRDRERQYEEEENRVDYYPVPKPRLRGNRRESEESEKQSPKKEDESVKDAEVGSIKKRSLSLGKIFSAVKTSGNKWKKRVMRLGHKKEKGNANPVPTVDVNSRVQDEDEDQKKVNEEKEKAVDDENVEDASDSMSEPFSCDSEDEEEEEEEEALTRSQSAPSSVSPKKPTRSVRPQSSSTKRWNDDDERLEQIKQFVDRTKCDVNSDEEELEEDEDDDEDDDDDAKSNRSTGQAQAQPRSRNVEAFLMEKPSTSNVKKQNDDEGDYHAQSIALAEKSKIKPSNDHDRRVPISQSQFNRGNDFDDSEGNSSGEEDANATFTFSGKDRPRQSFFNEPTVSSSRFREVNSPGPSQKLTPSSPPPLRQSSTSFVVKKTNQIKVNEDSYSSDTDISFSDLLDSGKKEIGYNKNNPDPATATPAAANKTIPSTGNANATLRRGSFGTGSIQPTSPMSSMLNRSKPTTAPAPPASDNNDKGKWNRTFISSGGRDSPSNNSWDSDKIHAYLP